MIGILLVGLLFQDTPKATLPSEPVFSLGAEEIVFRWETDRSAETDICDVPVRAFRDEKGEIVLLSGNSPDTYTMRGPDFSHLKRSKTPALRAHDRADAESFDNQEWLSASYTEDGRTVYALIHNEYHDPVAKNCRPGSKDPSNPCWYNSISLGVSTDAGRSFTHFVPPDHLVLAPPAKWDTDAREKAGEAPVYGFFGPSNILKGKDGLYYCFVFAIPDPKKPSQRGMTLMRTDRLDDPRRWRLWDGKDFSVEPRNPYAGSTTQGMSLVSGRTLGDLSGSVTFNTALGKYLLVGATARIDPDSGDRIEGFWTSVSEDMIHWSEPRLLRRAQQEAKGRVKGEQKLEHYPSFLDHEDKSRNFENTGKKFYLYFNRWNFGPGRNGYDRDLIRVPVELK